MKKRVYIGVLILSLIGMMPVLAKLPYYPIQLPRDDAAHMTNVPYPVSQMTEWWYFNGKLTSRKGHHFAYYFSITRYTNVPLKITIPVLTIQLMDIDHKKVYSAILPYLANETWFSNQWIDISLKNQFQLTRKHNTYYIQGNLPLHAGLEVKWFTLSLAATPIRDMLLVNQTGLIDLWDNTNSYYYIYTRLRTEGYFQLGNEVELINPLESNSWIDHQWGDFVLNKKNGWLWQHIVLDNNMDIVGGGSLDPLTHESTNGLLDILLPDGKMLNITDFTLSPRKIGSDHYPSEYQLTVPLLQLDLTITVDMPGQGATGIDEAMSQVTGYYRGKKITGYSISESTVQF